MDHFGPMRKKHAELKAKPAAVLEALEAGAKHAREVSGRTLDKVYKAVGLR
jgi:hypothetical protein